MTRARGSDVDGAFKDDDGITRNRSGFELAAGERGDGGSGGRVFEDAEGGREHAGVKGVPHLTCFATEQERRAALDAEEHVLRPVRQRRRLD